MDEPADRLFRCSNGHDYPAVLGLCVHCLASSRPAASVLASTLSSTAASLLVESHLAGRPLARGAAIGAAMELYREVLERLGIRVLSESQSMPRSGAASGPPRASDAFDDLVRDPTSIVGKVLAGAYRVDALLGSGGMGIVFQSTRLKTNDGVAIKVLRGVRDRDEIWKRLIAEALATRAFVHPGFTRLEDVAESDGLRFLVLELVSGLTLRQLLLRHGRLPPRVAIRIAREIAEAVAAAHDAGLLHAGLKPENVMLESAANAFPRQDDGARDLDGRVRVLDLGMSTLERLSIDGDVDGVVSSPLYRAPEQLQRKKLDARVDVYALGLILYECITGSNAFVDPDDASLIAVTTRKLAGEADRLSKHVSVSRALDDAVAVSLSRSREERPATMAAFLATLRDIERTQP